MRNRNENFIRLSVRRVLVLIQEKKGRQTPSFLITKIRFSIPMYAINQAKGPLQASNKIRQEAHTSPPVRRRVRAFRESFRR